MIQKTFLDRTNSIQTDGSTIPYFVMTTKMRSIHFLSDPETVLVKSTLQLLLSVQILTRGYSLAMVEMRSILARIVWNFDLKLKDAQHGWMDQAKVYIIFQTGPLYVHLTPRDNATHARKAPL
jgi:hypothetical protein